MRKISFILPLFIFLVLTTSCAVTRKYNPPEFENVIETIKYNNLYVDSIEVSNATPPNIHIDIEMTEDASPETTLIIWEELSRYVQTKVFSDWLLETEFISYRVPNEQGVSNFDLDIFFNCNKSYRYSTSESSDFTRWVFYKFGDPESSYLRLTPKDLGELKSEIENICNNVNGLNLLSHKQDGFDSARYDSLTFQIDYVDILDEKDISKITELVGDYISSTEFIQWFEEKILLYLYDTAEKINSVNFDIYLQFNSDVLFVSNYDNGSFTQMIIKE